jgi:hypothetical protein
MNTIKNPFLPFLFFFFEKITKTPTKKQFGNDICFHWNIHFFLLFNWKNKKGVQLFLYTKNFIEYEIFSNLF